MDEFNSDPLNWDGLMILEFLKSMKVNKRLIDRQAVIYYTGQDFLMGDDDQILKFYQATTEEEKSQLMAVRNAINEKSKLFPGDDTEDADNIAYSQVLQITGEVNFQGEDDSSLVKNNVTLEGSNTSNIAIESSRFVRYNDLPYDPFDFDAVLNFEDAKLKYESFLPSWSFYRNYLEIKSKRSQQKCTEMQLVLEVRKQAGEGNTNNSSTFALEKFAIKQNSQATIGNQQCDLILRDKTVSRKHALVENKNGFCTVQDLGSSCGTFLRIKNTQISLKVGSIFECGFQEFQVTSIVPDGDSAKIQLLVCDGSEIHKGKSFDLSIQNRFLIGRDIRCHFGSQFQDDTDLSSYHAKLSIKDNVLSIMDLDSAKGTWLRLAPQKKESAKFQIFNDSEIKINPFMLTVKINQMGTDSLLASNPQSNSNLCIVCKATKANLQLLPCQHVVCCKNCFSKLNTKSCPLPDCKQPIKQVETIYNC